jgi:molecular chaperone GrpE (heat shock protein)
MGAPRSPGERASAEITPQPPIAEQLDHLIAEVARLGREQFRATTQLEGCGSSLDQLGEAVRGHVDQELREHAESVQAFEALEDQLRVRLLMDLLPVVDALQASISAGRDLLAAGRRDPGGRSDLGTRPKTLESAAAPRAAFLGAICRKRFGRLRLGAKHGLSAELLGRRIQRFLEGGSAGSAELDHLAALEGWLEGLILVERRLLGLLDREGVRPIEPLGEAFDPHCHVAVAIRGEYGIADGTVVAEEVRGYTRGDRILRHAEVVIARAAAQSTHKEGVGDDTYRRD